jgi:SSS family solute:Na+ symporter
MIFLIPGLIGWALHQKGVIAIPAKSGGGEIDGDQVFPTLVATLLPVGLRGLVVAGLLSALMSSLASLFNSCATLFTVDIYQKLAPGRSERELVFVGRVATGAVVVAGLVWIPVMHKMAGGGLYLYLQSVQSYLAPPITAVFLLGLFWRRATAAGAFWGLIGGFVLGMAKLGVEAYAASAADPADWLQAIASFNFLYYSGVLLALSIAIVVAVSLQTTPKTQAELAGLTRGTLSAEDKRAIRESWNGWDIALTAAVLGLVVAFYLYFSFWLG